MTSKKQIDANRRNSKKSTGPRTEVGKARSRLNAITHGVFRSSYLTMFESETELNELTLRLSLEYDPEGPYEIELVRRLIDLMLKERRLVRHEAINREGDQGHAIRDVLIVETGKDPEFEDLTEFDKASAVKLRPMSHIDEALKFGRYQTMLQNQIERTVRELERVQDKRFRREEAEKGSAAS